MYHKFGVYLYMSAEEFLDILGGQKIVCYLGALDQLLMAEHRGFKEKSDAFLHFGPHHNLVD
jgi:hypothetical protein